MAHRQLATRYPLLLVCLFVSAGLRAADTSSSQVALESLLEALQDSGVDVIYSSELVKPDMAFDDTVGSTPLDRVTAALAAHELELRRIGPNTFVVARASQAPVRLETPNEPMPEISVYASRYAIEGHQLLSPHRMNSSELELVPGSHDDSLRALKSLPGLATNASGRPYIRGSLSEDILVRYDGITLLDPFHLKNFQSLISAIDPATIEGIEVFSGGFPVRYGTRSGGVIDVSAPSLESGYENRVSLSLLSGGVSSIGRSERWPLEWVTTVRRSTLDLLGPVEDGFGKPQFSDSLGRLRWNTGDGAWTAGWLMLDDRIELGKPDDEEQAAATYRDEYVWLARDLRVSDALSTRATAVLTSAKWHRTGRLTLPGVAAGTVDERTDFERVELANTWTWAPSAHSNYSFGAEAAVSRADRAYSRISSFAPEIAAGFGRPQSNDLEYAVEPRVFSYAAHVARRHSWADFEAELGVRFDGQHYNLGGDHTQISPRLNLRYDRSEQLRLYASLGRFTQAQHVEEWRMEEVQSEAHSAQVAIHSILGLTFDSSTRTRWGVEAYTKRWTTVAPYFDSRLDPLALSPDLAPDRIRLRPSKSEASGLELSLRSSLSDRLTSWGTLAWSYVADDFDSGDQLRSWDQPFALTAGLAWQDARYSLSALGTWHRGWPRTPFVIESRQIAMGSRNSERWRDFYSLDLRGSYRWRLGQGDLTATLELTNSTNRANECCALIELDDEAQLLEGEIDHWLPTIVNLGISYRWHSAR